MKYGYIVWDIAITLVLYITCSKSQMQYEICEYWVGQKVNFIGQNNIKIEVKFKNECGGIKNLQYWKFTVEIQPVINVEKLDLECDCVKQNCSKNFGNLNISSNKLYVFKFIPKCFMTACLVCPSRGVRLYRRVELKLSTTRSVQSFTENPVSHDKTLPIYIGCLGTVGLLLLCMSLLCLHIYRRQSSKRYYVTISSPNKRSGVQAANSDVQVQANNRKRKILVVSYPSNQSNKFLDILNLFSEHFETFHMLDCAYELTLNFYDWAEKVPYAYNSLVVILDEKMLEHSCKSDPYRLRDALQCFKSSLGPDSSRKIEVFVVTFGQQDDLVTKATTSYSYLRTGVVFTVSDDELNLDITSESSLVKLLSYLCDRPAQTLDVQRDYICKTIASVSETQKQQIDRNEM